MQIIVYSTSTCPYCKMLKDYLGEKQVAYVEKLIDQDDAVKEEMEKVSGGFFGVPFISIIKDDGTRENVIGFDKGKLNSILGIQS
jgi:glutaredoxin 3